MDPLSCSVVDLHTQFIDLDLVPALLSVYRFWSRSKFRFRICMKYIFFSKKKIHVYFKFLSVMKEFLLKRWTKIWKQSYKIWKKFTKYPSFVNLWSVFKCLDLDPYIIYRSGSRRANNIPIWLDPDLDPDLKHCFPETYDTLTFYSVGFPTNHFPEPPAMVKFSAVSGRHLIMSKYFARLSFCSDCPMRWTDKIVELHISEILKKVQKVFTKFYRILDC